MTTYFIGILRSPAKFMLLLACLNAAFYLIGRHHGLNENTWPGWIQGVGSVEAILAAVWVAWHQSAAQAAAAKATALEDLRSLIKSFCTELQYSYGRFAKIAGDAIEASSAGEQLLFTMPMGRAHLTTYTALASKLGQTPDDEFRRQIVIAFSAWNGLVELVHYNNKLLERMIDAMDRGDDKMTHTRGALGHCADEIRTGWTRVKIETEKATNLMSRL